MHMKEAAVVIIPDNLISPFLGGGIHIRHWSVSAGAL